MKVSLLLFASLREAVGERTLSFEIDDGATVHDLKRRLAVSYPGVGPMLDRVVCAIDDEYVPADELLREGAEVAMIPPVSGGAVETAPRLFRLTHEVMDPRELVELVRRDEAGAIALFYGVVRNHSEGRQVERLEYEAHERMAVRKLREAAEETKRRFPEISEVGA